MKIINLGEETMTESKRIMEIGKILAENMEKGLYVVNIAQALQDAGLIFKDE